MLYLGTVSSNDFWMNCKHNMVVNIYRHSTVYSIFLLAHHWISIFILVKGIVMVEYLYSIVQYLPLCVFFNWLGKDKEGVVIVLHILLSVQSAIRG